MSYKIYFIRPLRPFTYERKDKESQTKTTTKAQQPKNNWKDLIKTVKVYETVNINDFTGELLDY